MKIVLFALLIGGVFAVNVRTQNTVQGKVADKVFLERQKNLLRLLRHVHQPNSFQDQVQLGQSCDIEANIGQFNNPVAVKEFVQLHRIGLLPRREVFTVLNEVHRHQVIALFHVMYYAKTWDTFYKVCCWARDHVNEGMFVYAMTVAVLHRPDCKGIVLPAPYEIVPHLFMNHETIKQAREYQMQNWAYLKPEVQQRIVKQDNVLADKYKNWVGVRGIKPTIKSTESWKVQEHSLPSFLDIIRGNIKTVQRTVVKGSSMGLQIQDTEGDIPVVIIPANYSGWYLDIERDQKLTYFTEDIGLNSYYWYLHVDYPFWMEGPEFGLDKDHRGELFYYIHQQLLARYYLERLSNRLGEIEWINIWEPMEHGYVCTLQHENGLPFPVRPKKAMLIYDDHTKWTAEKMEILERRIIDAIDLGYILDKDGKKVSLYTNDGINVLGNLIEGNPDSLHRRYYGYLLIWAKHLIGFSVQSVDHLKLQPSALELYETAMRDPMFYAIHKRIVHYFFYYKRNLPVYTYTDLAYPEVKIDSVVVDKLITYFDHHDVELNNAIYNDFTVDTEIPKVIVKARQMRLNHRPFYYRVNVVSEKTTQAVVRVFLGPKHDEHGHPIHINENRVNFVELDKFIVDLKAGKNVIERNSHEARHTVQDRTSYYTLYRKVMLALEGSEDFVLDNTEAHCGFPNRLLLPKGTRSGMVYQIFVMVTPYQGTHQVTEEQTYTCGVGTGSRSIDNLPLGYPLDRKIDVSQFYVPNMHFQDVVIYHKTLDEVMELNQNV
ncbi:allergen Cr-PI-like [Chrysoperla carnea]|uniref:allergen Cr-PI-like n=1 Tax=Chrysoperla carnea TaxID=189513 RepID=UPI001D0895FA|nr:allergen Cr-PI-like [Chrysoperla carnea]